MSKFKAGDEIVLLDEFFDDGDDCGFEQDERYILFIDAVGDLFIHPDNTDEQDGGGEVWIQWASGDLTKSGEQCKKASRFTTVNLIYGKHE